MNLDDPWEIAETIRRLQGEHDNPFAETRISKLVKRLWDMTMPSPCFDLDSDEGHRADDAVSALKGLGMVAKHPAVDKDGKPLAPQGDMETAEEPTSGRGSYTPLKVWKGRLLDQLDLAIDDPDLPIGRKALQEAAGGIPNTTWDRLMDDQDVLEKTRMAQRTRIRPR